MATACGHLLQAMAAAGRSVDLTGYDDGIRTRSGVREHDTCRSPRASCYAVPRTRREDRQQLGAQSGPPQLSPHKQQQLLLNNNCRAWTFLHRPGPSSSSPLLRRQVRQPRSRRRTPSSSSSSSLFHFSGARSRGVGVIRAGLSDVLVMTAEQFLRVVVGVDLNRNPLAGEAFAAGAATLREVERVSLSSAGNAINTAIRSRVRSSRLEEAFMQIPDLESFSYRVVKRGPGYEIREMESYVVAETTIKGGQPFGGSQGSSNSFNTLAGYIFGKNTRRAEMKMTTPVVTTPTTTTKGGGGMGKGEKEGVGEKMRMTTPVIVTQASPDSVGVDVDNGEGGERESGEKRGLKMNMTTPVINRQEEGGGGEWKMSFLMESKYGEEGLPVPDTPDVTIRRVPRRVVGVTAFPGYVTDRVVQVKEKELRRALEQDPDVRILPGAKAEVAQYNDPFKPPMVRRNEVALEVEIVSDSIHDDNNNNKE